MNSNNQSFDYGNTASQSPLSTDITMSPDVNFPHGKTNSTYNTNYEINSTKPDSSTSNLTDLRIPQTFTYTNPPTS